MKIRSRILNTLFLVLWKTPSFRSRLDDLIRQRIDEGILRHKLKVTPEGQPGLGLLWDELKDIDLLRSNVKQLGLQISRLLYSVPVTVARPSGESALPLTSRVCRQSDFAEAWFHKWCESLHLKPILHRKVWEYAYVLQAMNEAGCLTRGRSGIGFGCGEEPIPSLLASYGTDVTVTDLAPAQSTNLGWVGTGQHTSSLEQAYYPDLVGRATFEQRVDLEYVDMNQIPVHLDGKYDFCWSICAFEHLGSIRRGLDFVRNSLRVLKPGGVAIHTTEFNLTNGETIDNWQTVLFQSKHFELLAQELDAEGHSMLRLDADPGDAFLDRFVDLPPYDWASIMQLRESAHLKLSIDGFPSTCVGIIVKKSLRNL